MGYLVFGVLDKGGILLFGFRVLFPNNKGMPLFIPPK